MCEEKERIKTTTTPKTDPVYYFTCSRCKKALVVNPGETYYSTEETKMIVCLECKEKKEEKMKSEEKIETFCRCTLGANRSKTLHCLCCRLTFYLSSEDDYYEGDQGSVICVACYLERIRTTLGPKAISTVKSRESIYGSPAKNFQRIARLWNSYINGTGKSERIELDPNDVGMMMILVKMARLMETPNHLDSLVDIAGYAECLRQIGEKE